MKCFAIMPYGKTEAEKKEYGRIYRFLIKTAAEDCDLTCTRSDLDPKGGHILDNVLDDLADNDIVIADISDLNWNVAYELGIRHALRKKGTILICNEEINTHEDQAKLPFDIQSESIIFYPKTWIDDMDDICDKIKRAINNCLNGNTIQDNPVHRKFPFLPEVVVNQHDGSNDDALARAKDRITMLEDELSTLRSRVESMGLSTEGQKLSAVNYSKTFKEELDKSIYISDDAVAKLRELLEEGDKEKFLEFLGKVLEVGFLDESDCKIVYRLCRELNVPSITRMYLEAVTQFYPENDDLLGFLANEYSKNYHTGEKALQMVNSIVGVSKKDGHYQISKTVRLTTGKLAAFFDVYQHLKKYADVLEIGALICERFSGNKKVCCMTLRNMTNAAIQLDAFTEAREYLDQLLTLDPKNDIVHWLCAKYEDAVENYPAVVAEMELCIRYDRTDTDYYMTMAGYICDNLYVRDPDTLEIRQIRDTDADEYAVPFLLTALSIDTSLITRVLDFLRRNKFHAYIEPVIDAYQSRMTNYRSVFPDLDYTAVDFCMQPQD